MNGLTKVADFEPRDCDDKAICDFMALVLAGGEITPERSGKSHSLGCSAYLSQCVLLLVRSSCTQTPRPLPEAEYPFELGWVFVMPSARGRRFSLDLTQAALSAAGTAGVFATSRTDNIPMNAVLTKFGFVPAGHPYPSTRGSHQLQLFVRRSAQQGAPGKRSPDAGH